jgi:hypothetical protein
MNLKLIARSVFVSLAVACGGGGVDTITKLTDEACACKDQACADAVNKKLDEARTLTALGVIFEFVAKQARRRAR